MIIDERQFESDMYGWYYLSGDPEPCTNHVIVVIANDTNGPLIYGCRECGLRYIEIEIWK